MPESGLGAAAAEVGHRGRPIGWYRFHTQGDEFSTEVVPTADEVVAQASAAEEAGSAFDVVVIGGGPGGYATALYGAAAGLSVAVVEMDKVGGTCLHRGCVPAKEFLETAAVYRTVSDSAQFGINAGGDGDGGPHPSLDFSVSQARKQQVVDQLFRGLAGLMKGRGIQVFNGSGTLLADHRVRIAGNDGTTTEITGTDIVLAAGSVPRTIPGFDVDGKLVMTSDEVLDLDRLPESVAVVGGGAIGCEFASLLSDLGAAVTVFEALPTILSGCDEDVVKTVARSFRKRGIEVKAGVQLDGHTPDPSGKGTTVSYGDGEKLAVDAVVVSVGRRPRTEGLLAAGTGVVVDDHGFVVADETMRTAAPGVWAVGDVVAGTPQLAHVGFAEGIVVIKGDPGRARRSRRLSAGALGHLLPSRGGLRRADRGGGPRGRFRCGGEEGPLRREQPGPDHRGLRRSGEGGGRTASGRDHGEDPRRPYGGPVGDRAARCRVPGRQLGGHGRRGGPIHPAAPVPVGDLRRDGAGPDRKGAPRCLR